MENVESSSDMNELKAMLTKHVEETGSQKAKQILENFEECIPKFKKLIPGDYKKLLALTAGFEEQGLSHEEAQTQSFYVSMGQKEA